MASLDEKTTRDRHAMAAEVEEIMAELGPRLGRGPFSPRVKQAIREVPRHLFVAPELASDAYLNRPLPIGYGQTISQPFVVALMTDLLDLRPDDRVLEVGTGCGYQTAILARLAQRVFTIEISEPLSSRSKAVLDGLNLNNVSARVGDGHVGWPSEAPFDAIVVTAAPATIPDPLVEQLAPGGRLVLPVGDTEQQLILVEKKNDHSTILRDIIPVCFVPLRRKASD